MKKFCQVFVLLFLLGTLVLVRIGLAGDEAPIVIGLNADLSGTSGRSGEAIRRGILLAIEEINAAGGVLGRPLLLAARDHRGNPARGADNLEELAGDPRLVAVVGGLHTSVILQELVGVHQHGVVYLVPWAAGTPVVKNGHEPNFVFRVSVCDDLAGKFLVSRAIAGGHSRLGLLMEKTSWGESNEKAIRTALEKRGLEPVGVQWFHRGSLEMGERLQALRDRGASLILLVANVMEGVEVVRSMAERPAAERLPILSHWGITGGEFFQRTREFLPKVDLAFLQTFSFLAPPFSERAAKVAEAYCRRFRCRDAREIIAPVGTAHAYDLVQLLRRAIERVGSTERSRVRDALEQLPHHDGLVRNYRPPFTPDRHDALDDSDFRLARYAVDGAIVTEGTGP